MKRMLHLAQIGFCILSVTFAVWGFYVIGKELAAWLVPSWMRYGFILALFGFLLLAGWTELGSSISRVIDRTLDYDPLFRRSLSKLEQVLLLLIILVVPAFIGIIIGERRKSAGTV
jgi:hypothetical protein